MTTGNITKLSENMGNGCRIVPLNVQWGMRRGLLCMAHFDDFVIPDLAGSQLLLNWNE